MALTVLSGGWLLFFGADDARGAALGAIFAAAGAFATLRLLAFVWTEQAEFARLTATVAVLGLLPSLLIPYSSDLVESQIVTLVLAKGNPALLTRDLVLQSEAQFGSYSFFSGALALLPERTLYVWLYALWLWSWMGYALIFLWVHAKQFGSRSPVLGTFAVLVGLGVTNYWDQWGAVLLGDNDLIYPFMRHQTLALVLGLAGVLAAWRLKTIAAGVLVGLALNLHVNTGQHCLIVLAVSWLLFDRGHTRPYAAMVAVALLTALPTLWPLVQMEFTSGPTGVRHPFIVVSGYFRHPNHLIPSSWDLAMYLRYAALLAAGTAAWCTKRNKTEFDFRLLALMWCPVAFVAIGYVFVELIPVDFVAKLQLSRMTLFTKVAAFLCLSRVIASIPLPVSGRIVARGGLCAAAALAVLLAGAIGLGRHAVAAPKPNALEDFFLKHTAKDSLVLVPLDWELKHFASRARRSVVVDLKRLPLGADADLMEYFERVCAVEGETPDFSPEFASRMRANRERAYHALAPEQIVALHARYNFDYVVRAAKQPRLRGLNPVYDGSCYVVYDYRDFEPLSPRMTRARGHDPSTTDD